jgi:hypothetical protein
MRKQRAQTQGQTKRQERNKTKSRSWLWASGVGVILLVSGVFLFNQTEGQSESWGLPALPREPRPATLSPALFTGKAREAYRIAREAPELLEHMPCYCGCYVGNRHRNNLDCYVDRHAVG